MNAFEKCWHLLKELTHPPIREFAYLGTNGNRDIGVLTNTNTASGKVTHYPHYRSSGANSGEAGTWKPFRGVTTHPEEVEYIDEAGNRGRTTPHKGWFIKPQLTDSPYFMEDYMQGDTQTSHIKYPEKRGRYGSPHFESLADWMNENVGSQQFQQKFMSDAEINQALIDLNAANMHTMAQGVGAQPEAKAGGLRAQGSRF